MDSEPPPSPDRRGLQPGIVVRNTFIDVCPFADELDSDESLGSPTRRNLSAPPSPTRIRDTQSLGLPNKGENYDSDLEEEEDPGSIPDYRWVMDNGIVREEDTDGPRVAPNRADGLRTQPQWLSGPPGSPKKVARRKVHGDHGLAASPGDRPPLGSFLRSSANPLLNPGGLATGGFGSGLAPDIGGFGLVSEFGGGLGLRGGFGLPSHHGPVGGPDMLGLGIDGHPLGSSAFEQRQAQADDDQTGFGLSLGGGSGFGKFDSKPVREAGYGRSGFDGFGLGPDRQTMGSQPEAGLRVPSKDG